MNTQGDLKRTNKSYTGILIVSLITALIILCIRMFVIFPVKVEGNSMDSTLITGEKYLVNKIETPERGDIIVFESPFEEGKNFVKRVIAEEGETIEINNGNVYINDKKIKEDYIEEHKRSLDIGETLMEDKEKEMISDDSYFVMGDNRLNSTDSRNFGEIKKDSIKGVLMKKEEKK